MKTKTKKSFLINKIVSDAENCTIAITVVKNVIASEAKQSICFFIATLFFSILNLQFSIANSNNDSLILTNYQQAYHHLNNMLSEKETLSFEDAIFTIENAYYNNQLSKTEFTNTINFHANRILQLANVNKQKLSQNMPKAINPLTPSPSEREGERLLFNWAIYTYMTDTTYWKENVTLSPSTSLRTSLVEAYKTNYPMTYQQGDPYGSSNWENTQIKTLLDPTKKSGNCFSLAVLYKIFSDRLQSEAYLTTAPQHIYIQHKGLDGNFYNVELTTHTFPGSGTIKTYTYTTHDAVTNGIALRRLNEKQEIALCLVYLAKGLEKKLRVKNEELRMGEFALACAETALKYDPLNLNAMLLKAEALESQIQFLAGSQNTEDGSNFGLRSSDLQSYENAVINTVHNVEEKYTQSLENTLFNLYNLGYRQMPADMQQTLLVIAQGTNSPSLGEGVGGWAYDTSLQYLTLSENLFPELESPENIIAIGNTSINIQSQKIASINTNENLFAANPITFALTIDPLAAMFPSESPYSAMGNDPINKIDPDGKSAVAVFDPATRIITIQAVINVYGDGATVENANTMQQQLNAEYNSKTFTATDENTGETYTVVFEVTVNRVSGKPEVLPTDLRQNYIEIVNSDQVIGSGKSHNPSFVSPANGARTGIWRGKGRNGKEFKDDNPTAHELIHLLGIGHPKDPNTEKSGSMIKEPAGKGHATNDEVSFILRGVFENYRAQMKSMSETYQKIADKYASYPEEYQDYATKIVLDAADNLTIEAPILPNMNPSTGEHNIWRREP